MKRPYLASRCYFAFDLSLFSCLEHENICWSSSGHFVIERASSRTCLKPQPLHPSANEAKPAVADLWTSCYMEETTLLCLSCCLNQVSACYVTKILIYVDTDNRCIAQLTNTRNDSKLRLCKL